MTKNLYKYLYKSVAILIEKVYNTHTDIESGYPRGTKMNKNEMVKNVKALAIPALKVTFSMSLDEVNETVRNAMFERFVSVVATNSVLCGISAPNARKFAVDVIQNDDYIKNCLTATINLVLNGGFFNRMALDGFINRLLCAPVIEICRKQLGK